MTSQAGNWLRFDLSALFVHGQDQLACSDVIWRVNEMTNHVISDNCGLMRPVIWHRFHRLSNDNHVIVCRKRKAFLQLGCVL